MHACTHACVRAYVCAYVRTYVHTYIYVPGMHMVQVVVASRCVQGENFSISFTSLSFVGLLFQFPVLWGTCPFGKPERSQVSLVLSFQISHSGIWCYTQVRSTEPSNLVQKKQAQGMRRSSTKVNNSSSKWERKINHPQTYTGTNSALKSTFIITLP